MRIYLCIYSLYNMEHLLRWIAKIETRRNISANQESIRHSNMSSAYSTLLSNAHTAMLRWPKQWRNNLLLIISNYNLSQDDYNIEGSAITLIPRWATNQMQIVPFQGFSWVCEYRTLVVDNDMGGSGLFLFGYSCWISASSTIWRRISSILFSSSPQPVQSPSFKSSCALS